MINDRLSFAPQTTQHRSGNQQPHTVALPWLQVPRRPAFKPVVSLKKIGPVFAEFEVGILKTLESRTTDCMSEPVSRCRLPLGTDLTVWKIVTVLINRLASAGSCRMAALIANLVPLD